MCGGVIYNSLGHKFLSPTINLYFEAEDYLKFLQRPWIYTSDDTIFREIEDADEAWPVVEINDIKVHFMHYKNYAEAINKWKERSRRINWNNIYVVFCEGDGCSYSDMETFDHMDYKNKVIFTHKKMPAIKSSFFLRNAKWTEESIDGTVRFQYPLTAYIGRTSPLRYIDEFDYVEFINKGALNRRR